jgi:hypothetical protein
MGDRRWKMGGWPPQTCPRPSSNPRPAGLIVRLRGGIREREGEREGKVVSRLVFSSGGELVAGGWWRVTRNEQLATRDGMGFPRRPQGREGL